MDPTYDYHQVFGNDLLREKLLGFVISNNGNTIIRNVASYRLVNKSWLETVSKTILQSQEPILHVSLDTTNMDKLDNFMRDVTTVASICDRITPFAISALCHLQPDYFGRFSNFLGNCGSGLTEFTVTLLEDQTPLSFDFSKIFFPNLRLFCVRFKEVSSVTDPFTLNDKVDIIHSVFNASSNLKSFVIHGGLFDDSESNCFDNIVLPPSITTLSLNSALNINDLRIPSRYSLTNLTKLDLCINLMGEHHTTVSKQSVYSILERFQKTLVHFRVSLTGFHRNAFFALLLLPVMEKLEKLEVNGWYYPFGSSLQQFVPVLNHLSLIKQGETTLKTWADEPCLDSVRSLKVSLDPEHYFRYLDRVFHLPTMENIKRTFPNIQKLDISLTGVEHTALRFIMTEMRSLQQLRILVNVYTLFRDHGNINDWDSIFIGIHKKFVVALREDPELWNDMELRRNCSLRDMTELHTLELVGNDGGKDPIISDTIFQYALFKMPKLKNLILKGPFFTTKEMEAKWREDGRNIENLIPDPTDTYRPVYAWYDKTKL